MTEKLFSDFCKSLNKDVFNKFIELNKILNNVCIIRVKVKDGPEIAAFLITHNS